MSISRAAAARNSRRKTFQTGYAGTLKVDEGKVSHKAETIIVGLMGGWTRALSMLLLGSRIQTLPAQISVNRPEHAVQRV